MPRIGLVTTTIYVPTAIHSYIKNAVENGNKDALFVITGDKKTPAEAQPFCEACAKEFDVEVIYQTPEDQIAWLEKYPELKEEIPWNSIQRRNLAILLAFERGCDVIVTIDDDNYFVEGQDFLGEHSQPIREVGAPHTAVRSSSRWINICEFLEDKNKVEFYPRGYPMDQRFTDPRPIYKSETQSRKVVVNGGLWLDDPDVDAITRLCNDISAVRYTREESFTMAKGTWCPFNSQNTAIAREVIPAYCLSPRVGRYDDIWASFVVLAIADHFDHAVMFGFPLVKQERNPHNYFKDHQAERIGLEHTADFCRWLRAVPLTGKTYLGCLVELIEGLTTAFEASELPEEGKAQMRGFVKSQNVWIKTMERMGIN
eukprot:CAMPEP_0180124328 /NCGR_PEP_ID=MMETSP0986-20121125/4591_1 /TAXON_ID=697907 /ORGANISM="non described non described, Strain CCMP2293" /LENGTH=370 /DNA_ID=CAMNT_0022063657 /DNA_START=35 /DNA_END=1147 /DNA_ORIENTATION=-